MIRDFKNSARKSSRDRTVTMMRAGTFAFAAIVLVCSTAAAAPLVTYESPCECRDNHGKHRGAEKNHQPYRLRTPAQFKL
jgi:hypothetical protein